MKKRALVVCLCTLFVIEAIALVVFATQKTESPQDAVAVNEVAESVRMDWHAMEKHKNRTGLDYVVLDADGTVQYRTKTGLSESINEAVMHRDTILDVEVNHEAEANAGKKELVAKLSHDIKTPVASIKAVSEVGAALAEDEKSKAHYTQIIQKADQINSLVTNLFTATLEELNHLSITPIDLESGELKSMLEGADYLNRAAVPEIPDCLIYADKLRLQQVFDNIFANSYKYAQTDIEVSVQRTGDGLAVVLEDFGGGVDEAELPLLKEKFKRGSNAGNLEGAGLGLYISDYFMQKMNGELLIQNGQNGLRVTVMISLSGTI